MLKKGILIKILVCSTLSVSSQINQKVFDISSTLKFDSIKSKLENYFTVNPDTSKDGANEEFERWEHFWSNRVQTQSVNEQGTYMPALKALHSQLSSPICNSINYPANWSNLGPGVTPSLENVIGRVNCVAFDPVNPNIYYAGTGNSGLWRTINGGVSWTCLTEPLRHQGSAFKPCQ